MNFKLSHPIKNNYNNSKDNKANPNPNNKEDKEVILPTPTPITTVPALSVKEEALAQIRGLNLYLIISLCFLIFINLFTIVLASTVNTTVDSASTEPITEQEEQNKNITITKSELEQLSSTPEANTLSILFNNSISQMVISTCTITVIGVLITKLRNLRKKLEMIRSEERRVGKE